MYKLFKKIGDRQIAKYYVDEELARKRCTKNWQFGECPDTEFSARSINKGKLNNPKYEITIDDLGITFGCPTEGLTNQIVELLSENYKSITAKKLETVTQIETFESDI